MKTEFDTRHEKLVTECINKVLIAYAIGFSRGIHARRNSKFFHETLRQIQSVEFKELLSEYEDEVFGILATNLPEPP